MLILLPSKHQTAAEEDASSCADNEIFTSCMTTLLLVAMQVAFSCKERVTAQ